MALPDKNNSETDSENVGSEESRLVLTKHTNQDGVLQLLANENELLDSDQEPLSTKDSTKDDKCIVEKNNQQNDASSSSTIIEVSKSIVGSPPDCEPSLLENYKTPHSQRRATIHRNKKHEDSFNSNPPSNNPQSFLLGKDNQRKIPEVIKKWPGSAEVWLNMVYNEEATLRSGNARNSSNGSHTSSFLPRMRAILIDWIMEVCDVYQLRRNTYYLTVDYIDRFLEQRRSIPKTQLQLVGVTCLFIASKIEEIYPPKLSEFAYVCDGACTEKEILTCERLVLHSLGWDVNPMTPTTWLNLYMQVASMPTSVPQQLQQQYDQCDIKANGNPISTEIYFPIYSAYQFVRASQIMDLFSLDPVYARFTYSVIAAAAMHLECGDDTALVASGFSRDHIDLCLAHMSFFHKVLCNENNPRLLSVLGSLASNSFSSPSNNPHTADESQAASYRAIRAAVPNLVRDEKHSMQTHCVDLDYFERAVVLRLEWLGFKVEKLYTKQYNTKAQTQQGDATENDLSKNEAKDDNQDDDGSEDNTKSEAEGEEPPDFSTVVTFQLERLWSLRDDDEGVASDDNGLQDLVANVEDVDNLTDDSNSSNKPPCQNNIFALPTSEKLLVNFDGILSNVHSACTDKIFLSLWRQTHGG